MKGSADRILEFCGQGKTYRKTARTIKPVNKDNGEESRKICRIMTHQIKSPAKTAAITKQSAIQGCLLKFALNSRKKVFAIGFFILYHLVQNVVHCCKGSTRCKTGSTGSRSAHSGSEDLQVFRVRITPLSGLKKFPILRSRQKNCQFFLILP